MQINPELYKEITKRVAESMTKVTEKKEINCTPTVQILADSISEEGKRLTTFQLKFWRPILPELTRHRIMSFSVKSSRATPVQKYIDEIKAKPWGPRFWGLNQKGMVPGLEVDDKVQNICKYIWTTSAESACLMADSLNKMQIHKQVCNRLLEPYMYTEVVVSATDWANFWKLRIANDAQAEIYDLAVEMKNQYDTSIPVKLPNGEFHLPYVTQEEKDNYPTDTLVKISAARCARVSYTCFDGSTSVEKDLALFDRLVSSGHFSPLEHVAAPATKDNYRRSNFVGWNQLRKAYLDTEFISQYDGLSKTKEANS